VILTDESKLRVKCSDATVDEAIEIIKLLEDELRRSFELGRPGIGLAAPQIGIQKRVAIIRISTGTGQYKHVDLINCRIAEAYDQYKFVGEGCLSFPNLSVTTLRYNEIKVVDNAVEPQQFVATGLFSIAIQHELNHLEGILLPDLVIK